MSFLGRGDPGAVPSPLRQLLMRLHLSVPRFVSFTVANAGALAVVGWLVVVVAHQDRRG